MCRVTFPASELERDAGDWVVRCRFCGAKNILATTPINKVPVLPGFEVVGWRD